MQDEIRQQPNLTVIEGAALGFTLKNGRLSAITTEDGRAFSCAAAVLTTGTFLNGLIHLGEKTTPAGRFGEKPSHGFSAQLAAAGLALARLKTGTPARLDGRSIDWGVLEEQRGDADPVPFSMMTSAITTPQVSCFITHTTAETHDIIARQHCTARRCFRARSRAWARAIAPPIEDKIHRFRDRSSHQIFLEPEGLDDPTVYPNGISTSLPEDVQEAFLRSIPGLSRVSDPALGLCHRV